MSQQTNEMRSKVAVYYNNHFNPSMLLDFLRGNPFNFREFAYESFNFNPNLGKLDWHRNLNFSSPLKMCEWLSNAVPHKFFFGAQYKTAITSSVQNSEWHSANLKFDVDIDESEEIRRKVCSCHGRNLCNACLHITFEAAKFLIEVLDDHYANTRFPCYKDRAEILFSGSRGTHIHYPEIWWVGDQHTFSEEEKLRRMIIDYIQMVKEEEHQTTGGGTSRTTNILHESFASTSLQHMFSKYITNWFFTRIPRDQLKRLSWFELKPMKKTGEIRKGKKIQNITDILTTIIRDLESNQQLVLNRETIERYGIFYDDVFRQSLLYRYPRYDGAITCDLKRIIKVPMSVDGSTGYIVQKIPYNDLDTFQITDLLHIDHFVTNT